MMATAGSRSLSPGTGERFARIRGATETLAQPLSPEDCVVQSMPDASPTKWHLGHTTWFFETFILEDTINGYTPFRPGYRMLFNSYYNAVGEQHPRPRRGLLTRPSLVEVLAYRHQIDDRVMELLSAGRLDDHTLGVLEVGLQHEQQHQELLLTDIKHALAQNPSRPAYRDDAAREQASAGISRTAMDWLPWDGGMCLVGHQGEGFCFDNERPSHRQLLQPFHLATRLVTCGEYMEFMAEGGYRRSEFWLSDGWMEREQQHWSMPLYWQGDHDGFQVQTLGGLREVDLQEPVSHVSYYEADAYARWAGARLPEEAEWDHAAADLPVTGNFVESGRLHPAAVPVPAEQASARNPAAEKPGLLQMFGDTWEWTRSAYGPFPGYAPAAVALGEYNGKFMCNQMVLKGGSCVSPAAHLRASYRNFLYPKMRWQFSGIRLARDTA
ncbi:MAG: ergothioneine biosynthesis protein EgtB [Acidobacteria bacterium]|nr:ergothioneine biosynthesis protein EgtB [Acidobacteriota bacterium]